MPHLTRPWLALSAVFFGAAMLLAQDKPALVTGLAPGPHAVGFQRQWVLDPSRVWERSPNLGRPDGEVARPIRIDIWYPSAVAGGGPPATLRDFLYAKPPDDYFAAANAYIQRWDENSLKGFAKNLAISFDTLLALTTTARFDAPVLPGRHPLVVYSGGWYNRSPDNIALAEYLAGSGYVVAEIPLFGAGLWTGNLSSNPLALETQVRDLEVSIGALLQHEWVDRTRVAAMGYSSGGIVALLLGERHPLVDAVIGLDPSYGTDPAKVLSSSLFHAEKFRLPLLTLRSGHESYTVQKRSEVIDALRFADRYTADVGRGTHGDFGDDVLVNAALSSVVAGEPRCTAEDMAAYRAVAATVRLFLDGVLRNEAAALQAVAAPTDATLRMTRTLPAPVTSK
jgi:dienelactone hydrolase